MIKVTRVVFNGVTSVQDYYFVKKKEAKKIAAFLDKSTKYYLTEFSDTMVYINSNTEEDEKTGKPYIRAWQIEKRKYKKPSAKAILCGKCAPVGSKIFL